MGADLLLHDLHPALHRLGADQLRAGDPEGARGGRLRGRGHADAGALLGATPADGPGARDRRAPRLHRCLERVPLRAHLHRGRPGPDRAGGDRLLQRGEPVRAALGPDHGRERPRHRAPDRAGPRLPAADHRRVDRGGGEGVIVAAGEALVDCFPRRRGFVARSGGAPYNWARGLARAGAEAGFSGVLGRDAFGRRLRRGLAADGVAFLGRFSDAPTPIALVAGGSFRFYHRGTALEEPVDLPPARAYLLGSLALQLGRVVPPESGFLALDPNVRPGLTPPAFREAFARWAERAHLVKLSREDARWLGGDPYAYARA
ncbi:MAG TPA: hypothetical protein ENJ76_03075, partial [Oceanithermus sp.]|nr:hypothetical protein [Oceanithermus sp.]